MISVVHALHYRVGRTKVYIRTDFTLDWVKFGKSKILTAHVCSLYLQYLFRLQIYSYMSVREKSKNWFDICQVDWKIPNSKYVPILRNLFPFASAAVFHYQGLLLSIVVGK